MLAKLVIKNILCGRKRDKYHHTIREVCARMAKYASDHGNRAAVSRFARESVHSTVKVGSRISSQPSCIN